MGKPAFLVVSALDEFAHLPLMLFWVKKVGGKMGSERMAFWQTQSYWTLILIMLGLNPAISTLGNWNKEVRMGSAQRRKSKPYVTTMVKSFFAYFCFSSGPMLGELSRDPYSPDVIYTSQLESPNRCQAAFATLLGNDKRSKSVRAFCVFSTANRPVFNLWLTFPPHLVKVLIWALYHLGPPLSLLPKHEC